MTGRPEPGRIATSAVRDAIPQPSAPQIRPAEPVLERAREIEFQAERGCLAQAGTAGNEVMVVGAPANAGPAPPGRARISACPDCQGAGCDECEGTGYDDAQAMICRLGCGHRWPADGADEG